ncbi:hypothetical protein OPT61_g2553 [Boeremia exigua]|uniref:Uncharacterized protein n=1 Tax=Boeremia exigua TaxID=749465 RepID=A0ACC2IL34_9PLEO|nr:hypothetical protein OPT61_g2553 [Boeremia exigua]
MADVHSTSYVPSSTPHTDPTPAPKRRKIIGQCPTCEQTFSSRHELKAHMADPSLHASGHDSDAISFGELSSEYDSSDSATYSHTGKSSFTKLDNEPRLETDGFEFSSASPDMQRDGFEFVDADTDPAFFSSPVNNNAERDSVHTVDDDEQPSAEYTPIETPPARPRVPKGGALGVLYCGTCDKCFGNETVFKRHFMFGVKHGEEPRDVRDLYYRVWRASWGADAKASGRSARVEEVDEMDM